MHTHFTANWRGNRDEEDKNLAAAPPKTQLVLNNPNHTRRLLTYVGSTQSFAQRPRPDVCGLVVDGQTLNTAEKAAIRSCRPDQPISTGGSAHIQGGSEGDLAVLALKECGEQWHTQSFNTVATSLIMDLWHKSSFVRI